MPPTTVTSTVVPMAAKRSTWMSIVSSRSTRWRRSTCCSSSRSRRSSVDDVSVEVDDVDGRLDVVDGLRRRGARVTGRGRRRRRWCRSRRPPCRRRAPRWRRGSSAPAATRGPGGRAAAAGRFGMGVLACSLMGPMIRIGGKGRAKPAVSRVQESRSPGSYLPLTGGPYSARPWNEPSPRARAGAARRGRPQRPRVPRDGPRARGLRGAGHQRRRAGARGVRCRSRPTSSSST